MTEAEQFMKLIAEHAEWMANPEKRLMLEKMAKRIAKEIKRGEK